MSTDNVHDYFDVTRLIAGLLFSALSQTILHAQHWSV